MAYRNPDDKIRYNHRYYAENAERLREDALRRYEANRERRIGGVTARRKANADWLAAYKVEVGCIDCGYRAHPAALHFDHRDPATKDFILSQATRTMDKLVAEVAKCDVRCANCHAVRTVTERHNSFRRTGGPGSGRVGPELSRQCGDGDCPSGGGEECGLRLFEVADLQDREAG